AYALMLSFLSDKVIGLLSLSDENTCASIFQKLKSTYLRDGAVNQILIRKRLAMLKMKKEVSMQEHLNEVNGLVNQLKSCGVKISDMDIIVYILISLPPEYDSTKSAIENQPSEHVSLRFVVSRLLDAEALLKDRRVSETKSPRSESSNDVAFSTNQRTVVCFKCNKKGHIARFCDKTMVCHHCGNLGHKRRNCRYLTRKKPPFKEAEAAAVSFVVGEGEVKKFIVDSGASHMCSQREWFEELKPSSGTVSCAAKSSLLEFAGTGVMRGRLKNGQEIVLKNVLFIPKLNGNLISVKQIQKAGYSVLFKDNKAIVKGKNKTFVLCELNSKRQYISDFIPTVSNTFVAETEEAELWHRRLGGSGNHALRKLGLPTSDSFCENCVLAKQSAEPIGKGNRRRESAPMRMIHSDLCGPVEPATLSGERYVLTFVDDYSRFCEVRLIKKKSDIAVEFKKFLKVNDTVKRIRCDNAKEYVSGELQKVASNAGVEIDP
ncbi:Copia protein, partial [Araneus ventricosus]